MEAAFSRNFIDGLWSFFLFRESIGRPGQRLGNHRAFIGIFHRYFKFYLTAADFGGFFLNIFFILSLDEFTMWNRRYTNINNVRLAVLSEFNLSKPRNEDFFRNSILEEG